jgi:hypothetical protein
MAVAVLAGILSKLLTAKTLPLFTVQMAAVQSVSWLATVAGVVVTYGIVLRLLSASSSGAVLRRRQRMGLFRTGVCFMVGAVVSSFLYVVGDGVSVRLARDSLCSGMIKSEASRDVNEVLISDASIAVKLRTAARFEQMFHPTLSESDVRGSVQDVVLGGYLLMLYAATLVLGQSGTILIASSCLVNSA